MIEQFLGSGRIPEAIYHLSDHGREVKVPTP